MGASLLFSCKSTPDLAPVDPIELLDGDAALYLMVPVQANQEFVAAAIQKAAKASEDDAKKIAERLDTAYIAIASNGELQFSADGKIPVSFAGMALSEKNGWKAGMIDQQVFYTHQQTQYQLCIPSSSNAFLSHNIEPMVKRFNRIAYSDPAATAEPLLSESLSEAKYRFLHENASPDILLYSPNPASFIKVFLGSSIQPPVDSITATLSQYRGVKDQFNVKFIINMSDPRTVKATIVLLKTVLFGVPAKITQTGQSQITITDLPVSKVRLLSMMR